MQEIIFKKDVPEKYMGEVTDIFYEAFGQKFMPIFKREDDLKYFLRTSLKPEYMFAAYMDDKLAGIAGIQIGDSKLIDVSYRKLRKRFGFLRSVSVIIMFRLFFSVKAAKGTLRIDVIAVHPEFRGKGIGTHMIGELEKYALLKGLMKISLEVVDTNPSAKKLYTMLGFKKVKTKKYYFFTRSAGFSSEDIMEKRL